MSSSIHNRGCCNLPFSLIAVTIIITKIITIPKIFQVESHLTKRWDESLSCCSYHYHCCDVLHSTSKAATSFFVGSKWESNSSEAHWWMEAWRQSSQEDTKPENLWSAFAMWLWRLLLQQSSWGRTSTRWSEWPGVCVKLMRVSPLQRDPPVL